MRFSPFLGVLVLMGCQGSESEQPIELGHLAPPTQGSRDEEWALQLAVEERNKNTAGLPQGRRIQIRHASGGQTAVEWGAQSARLIELNHAMGLIGGNRAAAAERIGMTVQGENVIAVSTAGWGGPTPAQNLFTIGLSPGERGRALAVKARELNPKVVLVIREAGAVAAGVAADRFVAEVLSARPAPIVRSADLAEARETSADVVFLACTASAAARERGRFPTARFLFGGEDSDIPALVDDAERTEGFIVAMAANPADRPERLAAFAAQYQERYRQPPTLAAILAHDALSVWLEAARRAESLDAAALRGELLNRNRPFEVLGGSVTFGDDHTAQRTAFVGTLRGGRIEPSTP